MPGIWVPGATAAVAVALLAMGGARLPADVIDIPANVSAKKLTTAQPVAPPGLTRVLSARAASIPIHMTADRWFDVGYAHLMNGDPAKSTAAFEQGLRHAPARGIAWAAYANALDAAGEENAANAARRHSIARAPHDPRAVRLRRR